MTKHQIEKSAREELQKLNAVIDWKIIKGLSYRREAQRHKFLLSRLMSAPKQTSWSWKMGMSLF